MERRYAHAPEAAWARDPSSVYLHLLVNRLELDALTGLIGRDPALERIDRAGPYRWGYRTVVADWNALSALYRDVGIAPIPSAQDIRVAGG